MKKHKSQLMLAGLLSLSIAALAQDVKLAGIALGMDEAEVKAGLAPHSPHFLKPVPDSTGLQYLIAETNEESFAVAFLNGKVVAFSTNHILPAGQLPFLPSGQQPTVGILRNLVIKETWQPAEIAKGETLWLSDTSGKPLFEPGRCAPASGPAWVPYKADAGAEQTVQPTASAAGLMKPVVASYPANCGVSIRLNETPAASESDRVTTVSIQVLNIKAIREFVAKTKAARR